MLILTVVASVVLVQLWSKPVCCCCCCCYFAVVESLWCSVTVFCCL